MRYLMRQRAFSFPDRYVIKNASDEDVGFIDAQAFTLGHKLSFIDVNDNEVAYIQQKLMTWGATYEIYRAGSLAARVKNKPFKLTPTFDIDVLSSEDPISVAGDMLQHEYSFVRNGNPVATVSKQWWTVADTYGVDVLDAEDHVLILASTVVIDLVHEDAR